MRKIFLVPLSLFPLKTAIRYRGGMEVDDKTLLALLEEDPERGISLLKARYAEHLRFTAAQRLDSPDDIRECVYDTLTDFYLQRDQFDGSRGSLRSYLIAIADRKAIRKYRENQRQWLAAELSGMEAGELMNWERTEALRQAMKQLPTLDRQALELKYFHGYTAREIANHLGMEHDAVKKRLQRALKKLQRLMEE